MTQMTEDLQRWYAARSAEEQRTLKVGAVVALIVLLTGLLFPLHREVLAVSARVEKLRGDLGWLQSVAPQLRTAMATVPVNANESLVVRIDRAARATGIAGSLTSTQPTTNGGVDVKLDRVSFDALVSWLGQLTQRYGVQIESAGIEGTGEPGLVRASLVLRTR